MEQDPAGDGAQILGQDAAGTVPAYPTLLSLQTQIKALTQAHSVVAKEHTTNLMKVAGLLLAAVVVSAAGTYFFVVDQTSARLKKTDAAVAQIGQVAQSSQDLGKAALEALASKTTAKTAAADLQKLGFTEVKK